MEIGRFNSRVKIQRYSESQQAGTEKTNKDWTTIATVWCDIQPVKGLVTFDTMQIDKTVTTKIFMRYRDYITTELWLYYDSRRFRIRSVRNIDERNRFLELLCEEDSLAIHEFEADIDRVGEPLRILD